MVNKTYKTSGNTEKPYYHFTSLENFFKINNTGKLRLSACNCAKNSAIETMSLYSAIENIIDNDSCLRDQLLNNYSCNQSALINKIIEHREQSYMACFSAIDENNEETEILKKSYMWEFYADNSKGVVIKFNINAFHTKNMALKLNAPKTEALNVCLKEE